MLYEVSLFTFCLDTESNKPASRNEAQKAGWEVKAVDKFTKNLHLKLKSKNSPDIYRGQTALIF